MAHSTNYNRLRYPTNRAKLPAKRKPYKLLLAPGIFLAYRKNATGPGSWSVEAGWLKRFALADDVEKANGSSVMDFAQAKAHALKLVRGSEGAGAADRPVTVGEALDAYQTDLEIRGASPNNAKSVRNHCSPIMLAKTVALLTETELETWRNGLITEGLKVASANRIAKSMKAALTLAARRDKKRIMNGAEWKVGLRQLKVKGSTIPPRDNYYQTDATILAIVNGCYEDGADFGTLIDVLAQTGTRESQAYKLYPRDLLDDDTDQPRLMMWCSNKGQPDRDPEQRAVPITVRLAKILRARGNARGPNRPLLKKIWNLSDRHFRPVLERLGLDLTLSPYTLRHSSIIRQIKAKTSTYLIAHAHDTSEGEIKKTYGRYLDEVSGDPIRNGLLADLPVESGNVVRLKR
jgi:hypothetical protein